MFRSVGRILGRIEPISHEWVYTLLAYNSTLARKPKRTVPPHTICASRLAIRSLVVARSWVSRASLGLAAASFSAMGRLSR